MDLVLFWDSYSADLNCFPDGGLQIGVLDIIGHITDMIGRVTGKQAHHCEEEKNSIDIFFMFASQDNAAHFSLAAHFFTSTLRNLAAGSRLIVPAILNPAKV